jgi:hypothetical protein
MKVRNVLPFLRKNALGAAVEILVNIVLPYVIYMMTKAKFGDVNALLASMAPPVLWSVIEFVRRRRIDTMSIFVLAGIVLSLLAFIGGGSARFLQLRENLVAAVIGLAFLVSAAIGKPLIYQLARAGASRKSPSEAASLEALKDNVHFRRTMTLMTLVWGFGLLAQTAVACILVFTMSIQAYLLISPIVGDAMIGALALWTFWYGKRQQRIGVTRRAAE